MEAITLESVLLIYGPLGIMVIGLSSIVVYLWRELERRSEEKELFFKQMLLLLTESSNRETSLVKEFAAHETQFITKYVELSAEMRHSIDLLAERIKDG